MFLYHAVKNESTDSEDITGNDKIKVTLSPEEFISVAYDDITELSSEEVLLKVEKFSSQSFRNDNQFNNPIINATIADSYSLELNDSSNPDAGTVHFKVVFFEKDGNRGSAVVCSDRRYPEVLAYLDRYEIKDIESYNRDNPMMWRVNQIAVDYINRCNEIKDSLKSSTVKKICDRLGIEESEFSFRNYISNIIVPGYNILSSTRFEMMIDPEEGTLLNKVGPLCGTTNIIQGWPCNQFIAETDLRIYQSPQHYGHYPAGCVPVALATMCSYIRPTIYCDELKRNINWDYVFDSTFDPLGFEPVEYDPSTPQAIEVGHLLKIIADGTKTTFNGDGGHTTISNAASYMNKIGINMSSSTTAINYSNVRSSLTRGWFSA